MAFDMSTDTTDREKVTALQQALVTLGQSLPGRNNGVDGSWGRGTEAAYNEVLEVAQEAARGANL